jgi:hypothetical protein
VELVVAAESGDGRRRATANGPATNKCSVNDTPTEHTALEELAVVELGRGAQQLENSRGGRGTWRWRCLLLWRSGEGARQPE